MKEKVTIVPSDMLIIVEGAFLEVSGVDTVFIDESVDTSSLHAIQWEEGCGHIEYKDEALPNQALSGTDDYALWIAPFVTLWEAEKASLEAAQASAEAEALALYNSTEACAERVRTGRDARITACDWVISRHAEQVALGVDTTLTEDEYTDWLSYRQNLRDLPDAEGFPWSGGADDEACPWPMEPQE